MKKPMELRRCVFATRVVVFFVESGLTYCCLWWKNKGNEKCCEMESMMFLKLGEHCDSFGFDEDWHISIVVSIMQ